MDRKDYLKSRISEALKGPIEESYKKKYETAPEGVKAVADHMAMLKKQPTDTLERMVNQHYKVHSAKSKNEFVGMLMGAKFGKKKLEAHDSHFQTEQKQGVAEGYWEYAVKKAEAERLARKDKPFEKNPQSHDKDGVYKGDKDLAGNPVPKRKKQGVAESSFTAAASMHAATRKQSGGKTAQPTHGIKVGDAVTTADGKQGRVKFVHGDDIQVTGTNPYYRDRVTNHSAKDLKKSVAEEVGLDEGAMSADEYKQQLINGIPHMMKFFDKTVKGWKPSKDDMMMAVDAGHSVMKKTGDVHQAGKAFQNFINSRHKMSAGATQKEEYEPVNEASQKLMNYLRDKHGAALQKMSSPELQKAKKAAAAEMKAKTAEKKAAAAEAPKEKVKDTGEHIVVQMRKIADYKPGKYPVRVSPKRSVNVHSDAARKVVASHDQLKKPVDKRQFRISLTKRLRKLKEERARC